ncbi:tetratricopeptide repeat protein [uncultured Dokdonia sp.]|uniref:tetratricopeptide repeat protein n=1 Tax=uncultured Dokdonia sp. TaxID=575653 RepID=UPI0026093D8E|nr:tetratricopeptide repeat protein [uncultured Dokdonia sp.]
MNSSEEHTSQKKIDSYLNNTMSTSDRLLFEKEMKNNADLKEDVLLQKSISEVIFNHHVPHIEDSSRDQELAIIKKTLEKEAYQKYNRNIEKAASIYSGKSKKRKFFYFGSIAATVLVFIAVLLFPNEASFETLYAEYSNWDELTSYVEQSESQDEFPKGELLYKEKKYAEAIQFFETYIKDTDTTLYAAGLMYLGASYFKEGDYEKAIETYDVLIHSDSYDNSKGYWYQLLIYLKQKDESKVKATIQIILSDQNNYKYNTVLEMEKDL